MDATRTRMDGKWHQVKGKLKETWGELTDDDIRKAEGKFERLVGVIKDRTGEAQQSIEKKLDEIAEKREKKREEKLEH